jgi:SH3-like domain-containing protein
MRIYQSRLIWLTLLLCLIWSCAQPQVVKIPEGPYFVTSPITYLRDRPEFSGNVVSPLFRGDRVNLVEGGDSNWWKVKLQRTGQTGWVRKELLSLTPVASVFYYVQEDTLPLLECPRVDCLSLQLLFRGDQVQRVEEGQQGWWRVLAIKGHTLGWVRASALAESRSQAQLQQQPQPYYYVARRKIILRALPSAGGETVRTLQFNDQVQKLSEVKDWFRVRQPASGAVGWVPSRDLATTPLIVPRGRPVKKLLRPFKQREEPLSEPDFM